jgi:hypothetical protein
MRLRITASVQNRPAFLLATYQKKYCFLAPNEKVLKEWLESIHSAWVDLQEHQKERQKMNSALPLATFFCGFSFFFFVSSIRNLSEIKAKEVLSAKLGARPTVASLQSRNILRQE